MTGVIFAVEWSQWRKKWFKLRVRVIEYRRGPAQQIGEKNTSRNALDIR